jgi:hypothetical protein
MTTTQPPPLSPNDARAQAKAAKAYAKAQRPFYKKKRWWLLGVIVLIVIISIAASAGSKKNTNSSSNNGVGTNSLNSSHPPQKDVTVSSCTFDSTINGLTAKLQIINHSSKTSNYIVDVVFNDSKGVQIGSTSGVDNNVAAGQTAVTQAVDVASQPPAGGVVNCVIKNVNRFAS